MTFTLYSKYDCPFCWQVKIALSYLNIQYDLLEKKDVDHAALRKLAPQTTLPILLNDETGETIWDSVSIMFYLQDHAVTAGQSLLPGTLAERHQIRQLAIYSNQIAGRGLREVIFEKRSKAENEWDRDRISDGEVEWNNTLDYLENKIESSESFFKAGFSWADTALLPRFVLAEKYAVGVTSDHPKLFTWFKTLHNTCLG